MNSKPIVILTQSLYKDMVSTEIHTQIYQKIVSNYPADQIMLKVHYRDQFDYIWPSHADIPISPDVVMKLHDGAQDILDGKFEGRATDMFGKSIVEYDLGFCTMLCD